MPPTLRNAVAALHRQAVGSNYPYGEHFGKALHRGCETYFGWTPNTTIENWIQSSGLDDFLDLAELIVEEGPKPRKHTIGYDAYYGKGLENAEAALNALFERHRFGYRIERGDVHKIGSPALDQAVVGPALLAVQRSGWEEAERSYREALDHQRSGSSENDDALTAANAAIEAALKAVGMKGANLGPLAASFKKSGLVPAELAGVPEALDALLKRSGAIRSSAGDAHGKEPGSPPVPQALSDLAIHWAGAFIVYLAETTRA